MHARSHPPHAPRLLAVALACSLAVAACGGSDEGGDTAGGRSEVPIAADPDNCPVAELDARAEDAGPVQVTVWHPYNALTQEALEEAAERYNQSQSAVRVSVEAQGTYPELLKKYEDSLGMPGDLPDVIFSEDTTLQYMIDSGTVIPAEDCIAADPGAEAFYDDLLPAVRGAYTVDDRLWAAAFGVSMPVMYLNNDHLERAGLSTDEPPRTLEEVRRTAEAIAAAGLPGLEAPVVMQLYAWYPENWLTGARQEIVDERNGRAALATRSEFDSEATRLVVGWLHDMARDDLLKAYPYSSDISQYLALGQSTSSILIDGSRAITTVDAVVSNAENPAALEGVDGAEGIDSEALRGLDVAVAPIPGLEQEGQGAVWGSAGFLVAGADPAKVAGGWDFLKFFNETPNQVEWLQKGSYLPVTRAAQDSPEVQQFFRDTTAGRWLGVVNDQLLSVDPAFPGPVIGPYNEFRAGFHTLLDDVVLGGKDPDDAIAAFDRQFQSALDRYAEEVS